MTAHDEFDGLAGEYVLGSLDSAQAERFRHHLTTCEQCATEVDALEGMVAVQPLAPVATEPRRTAPVSTIAALRTRQAELEAGDTVPRRGRVPRQAMTAGLALLAIGVMTVALSSESAKTRVYRARVAWRSASAVLRVGGGRPELLMIGVPPAPAGEVYEVWLNRPRATPARVLFNVTSGGGADLKLPRKLDGVSSVMVTPEPSGGSAHPTALPVIFAQITP